MDLTIAGECGRDTGTTSACKGRTERLQGKRELRRQVFQCAWPAMLNGTSSPRLGHNKACTNMGRRQPSARQPACEKRVHDAEKLHPQGKMWQAFERRARRCFLIDEIDKADIRIPQRPFQELDRWSFSSMRPAKRFQCGENRPS